MSPEIALIVTNPGSKAVNTTPSLTKSKVPCLLSLSSQRNFSNSTFIFRAVLPTAAIYP